MTVYRESYTRGMFDTAKSFASSRRSASKKGAGVHKSLIQKRKKRSTLFVGEDFRDFADPKQSTHIQRTWVYGKDRATQIIESKIQQALKESGGKATRKQIFSSMEKTKLPQLKKGDGPNSLPIEGKISQI